MVPGPRRPTPPRSDIPQQLNNEQRAGLLRAKLVGLVRDLTGMDTEPGDLGTACAVVADATAFVLTDAPSPGALAGAMAWAQRHDTDRLVLFVDEQAAVLARMAGYFAFPTEVRAVAAASSAVEAPAPLPVVLEAPVQDPRAAQMRDQDREVVVEAGVVRGEVLGLEVARLVVWPTDPGGDGELHLEAGVGRFDRDAAAAMHQGEAPIDTLTRTVAMVRAERRPGRSAHPLAVIARERWLRSELLADPSLLGAADLRSVETTVERSSVRDPSPAAAMGTDNEGLPLLVVCSVGVDLGLVPIAADTRAMHDPSARLVLVLPERDRIPATVMLASGLRSPAEIVSIREPWAS